MDDEFNRKQSISAPKAGTQTEQSQRNQDTLDPILKNVLVILLNNSRKGCRFSALILGRWGCDFAPPWKRSLLCNELSK